MPGSVYTGNVFTVAATYGVRVRRNAAGEWVAIDLSGVDRPTFEKLEATWEGKSYVEVGDGGKICSDCAFRGTACRKASEYFATVFGGGCDERHTVYIPAE